MNKLIKLKNKKGFTLIELVIVVSILAILAAVAVPAAGGITKKAKDSADLSNLALYQSAVERYNVDNDVYPPSSTEVKDAVKLYTNKKVIKAPASGNYYYVVENDVTFNSIRYVKGQIFIGTGTIEGTNILN